MLNYLSRIKQVLRQAQPLHSRHTSTAYYSTNVKDDTAVYDPDEEDKQKRDEYMVDLVDVEERERKIERMRNKSRLSRAHRNFLFNKPTTNQEAPFLRSLAASRGQYGKYGAASGVDPRLCFETPEEKADREEYERVAYPFTVQELMERNQEEKNRRKRINDERQNEIAKNLTKVDKWMADMAGRAAKKEELARLAKERRDQIMEDIRLELGYTISRRDPRYQEILERKEEEQKKEKKKLKKLAEAEKKEKSLQRQYEKLQQATVEKDDEPEEMENKEATDGVDENDGEIDGDGQKEKKANKP